MSLTLKADGTHAAPWVVIPDGTVAEQREYMIELFGVDRVSVENLTTYELFLQLDSQHKAAFLAAKKLGATPVSKTEAPVNSTKEGAKDAVDRAFEEPAAPVEPPHPHQGVLNELANATSKRDLQSIYLANNEAFKDPDVQAMAAKRGKELA